MTQRPIYDAGQKKTLGWPLMLADMGLLLMGFFALMVAQSGKPGQAAQTPLLQVPTALAVPKDAESLLANLRANRLAFEPLDLPMPQDLPKIAEVTKADRVEHLRVALMGQVRGRQYSIERAGDSVVVSLGTVDSFAAGSAELDTRALQVIRSIADVIGDTQSEIAIEGHADSAPLANARFKDNWELAGARAVAVLRELSRSPALSASSLRAVSFGDQRPLSADESEIERDRNRRVEIRIRPL